MTYPDYMLSVQEYLHKHPEKRRGQAYFNVLYDFKPTLAEYIVSSQFIDGDKLTIDPYHNDDNLESFLLYVCEHWEDK